MLKSVRQRHYLSDKMAPAGRGAGVRIMEPLLTWCVMEVQQTLILFLSLSPECREACLGRRRTVAELAFGAYPRPPGALQRQAFSPKSRSFSVMTLPSRSEQQARRTGAGVDCWCTNLEIAMALGIPVCPCAVGSRTGLPRPARIHPGSNIPFASP